jgi:hypothetical protein
VESNSSPYTAPSWRRCSRICSRVLDMTHGAKSNPSIQLLRPSELGHNIATCALSRMILPNRLVFWTANLATRKASAPLAPDSMSTLPLVSPQRRPLGL